MSRTDKHPKDFESAMLELETLVADLESGRLNLEAALAAYKRGSELTAFCQKTLDVADREVRVLDAGVLRDLENVDD